MTDKNNNCISDQYARMKQLEKHMGSEQAKLLMPFFTGNGNLPNALEASAAQADQDKAADNNEMMTMTAEKERQVQEILIEATRKSNNEETIEDDHNKNNLNNTDAILKPLEAPPAVMTATAAGGEISA